MPVDPGSTLATALNLGDQSGSINRTFSNFVGGTDLGDYLRFSLSSSSNLTVSLTNLQADADLRLLNSSGQVLQTSANFGTDAESINAPLAAGVYYLRVTPYGDAITNYTLGIAGSGGTVPEPGTTLATAFDLGGYNYISHSKVGSVNRFNDPADLYRFELNDTSDINLLLTELTADADVEILNNLGAVLASSDRSGTTDDSISSTLPAGTYFVRITPFDGGTIDYRLNLDISLDDNAGNTLATARKLNGLNTTLSGTQVFNDFVSGAGGSDPQDFYRFTLLTQSNYSIGLSQLSSDVDLRIIQDVNNNGIVDAGEAIASSIRSGTLPENLSGQLNAGTYFIQVYPFSNAATSYQITITASPQDGAGNSTATARDVGTLVGDRSFNDFVGIVDPNDFYRFVLPTTSNFRLDLTGLEADVDVRLLNSAGTTIASSIEGGTTSENIARSLTAGTYFVQVYPFNGSSSDYRLSLSASPSFDGAGNSLSTARNVGTLTNTLTFNDFVGAADTNDFYRFNLNTGSNFNLNLSGLSADADVELIQDLNNNGSVDNGEILASLINSDTNPETLSRLLAAGSYYVRVYPFLSSNTNYSLSLGAIAVGDNTLPTATNLGGLTTSRTVTGFVGNTDADDFYRFTLSSDRSVGVFLDGLSADADIQLIRDFNNNGIVDSSDVLAESIRAGSASEAIFNTLSAGTYFVRVLQFSGNTNYSLTLTPLVDGAGSTLGTAANLGTLSGSRTVNDVIGEIDPSDIYRFSLNTRSRLNLELDGVDAYANAQIIQDLNSNGLIDSNEILAATTRDISDIGSSSLAATLNPGNYFVRVLPSDNANTRYSLNLTTTAIALDGAGNTLATARNLGNLTGSVTFQDFVGQSDRNDYYRFALTGNTNFNLLLSGLTDDADVELIRDLNGNGLVDAGEVLRISDLPGTSSESINLNLGAGSYFIRVYPFFDDSNTTYTLNLSATAASNPFNSQYGYGLADAAAAVARATGQFSPFPNQPTFGGATDWGVNLINAPEAWAQGYTGQGVIVAVIDSGVDYTHPDLAGRIWVNTREIPNNGRDDDGNGFIDDVRGWDFVGRDNRPFDFDGHGTHVAGTIAANNNGIGATGVAYNAQIMPVRVLGQNGGSNSNVAAGIRYAANNGAQVINLSLGGPYPSSEILSAVQYANQRGAVVVFSSGNNGSFQPGYPARYATQAGIAVGAVGDTQRLASYSNRAGATPLNFVVAPGGAGIRGQESRDVYSTLPGGTFGYLSGTSMAAPHVSGLAALILSANPTLTPAQVISLITTTANSSAVRV
ncbi:S8 family serine peptidase [Leptolyngbyaceae cyanobacterium UHCC 1019]